MNKCTIHPTSRKGRSRSTAPRAKLPTRTRAEVTAEALGYLRQTDIDTLVHYVGVFADIWRESYGDVARRVFPGMPTPEEMLGTKDRQRMIDLILGYLGQIELPTVKTYLRTFAEEAA